MARKITEKKLLTINSDGKTIAVYRKAYETLIKKVNVISQKIMGNQLVIQYSAKRSYRRNGAQRY